MVRGLVWMTLAEQRHKRKGTGNDGLRQRKKRVFHTNCLSLAMPVHSSTQIRGCLFQLLQCHLSLLLKVHAITATQGDTDLSASLSAWHRLRANVTPSQQCTQRHGPLCLPGHLKCQTYHLTHFNVTSTPAFVSNLASQPVQQCKNDSISACLASQAPLSLLTKLA